MQACGMQESALSHSANDCADRVSIEAALLILGCFSSLNAIPRVLTVPK